MASILKLPAVDRGFTYRHRLGWFRADKTPIDLTDCLGELRFAYRGVAYPPLTVESGGVTLGGVDGTIDLHMTKEQTAELGFASVNFELVIIMPNGDTYLLASGSLEVK